MAENIVNTLSENPERTVALRKLLENKDAAVRAIVAREVWLMATITLSGYVAMGSELWKAARHYVLSFRIPVDTGYGDRRTTTWYAVSHFRGTAKLAEIIRKGT